MTPEKLIEFLGKAVYRRPDYLSQLSEDIGISRGRLERMIKSENLDKDMQLAFKGYCLQEAEKLENMAKAVREIATNL